MKRKKYQIGGPIDGYVGPVKPNPLDPITFDKSNFPPNTTLNIQTLGHIKFNSNEARSTGSADSRFVVKDILSGKDYGVIRGTDGKYQFWSKELQDSEKKWADYKKKNPDTYKWVKDNIPEHKVSMAESKVRASYVPINNAVKVSDDGSDYVDELAHVLQWNKLGTGRLYGGGEDYHKKGTFEYGAHSELQNEIVASIKQNKSLPRIGIIDTGNPDSVHYVTSDHMISLPNGNFIVGDITNPRDLYTHNRPYLKDKYKFREVERQLDGKYKPIKEYKRGDLPLELENQVYIKQTGFKNKDDKDMKKRKQYVTGGDIGSGLQKAAPGLAAIPGYGWIAGAAAYGLGSFLKMTEPKEVKYGSPGMTMATGGEINIKPSKRGTFTVAAKNRGKGVQEFASQVLANKENYSPAIVKKANFARNAAKWHEFGGPLDPIVSPTDSIPSTYQLITTSDPGIISTATPINTPSIFMAPKNQTPTYITREHKWTNNRKDQVWEDRRYRMGTTPAIEFGATLNDPIGQPYSNKSKSKDRYREMQAGGDIQLSSDSFQVKGNPQVTDGNTYPQLNAKLDHNEVVSTTQDGNKFIFSNTLKLGKKSFAEIVKPIERAKGKAEKLLMVTPGDRISKNTVALSNKLLDDVANQQEQLAVAKGHRNSDGSTKQPGQYATGGPIYPEKDKPFMSTNDPSIFYNPYNNSYYKRQSNGSYSEYSADRLPYIDDSAIQSHLQRYPGKTEQPPINTLSQFNEANMSGMYNSQESSLLDQVGQPLDSRNSVSKSPSKRKAPIVKKTALARTSVPLPPGVSTHYNPANRNAEMTVLPDGSVVPSNIISDTSTPYNSQGTADQRAAVIEKVPFLWDSDKDAINKPWKTDEGYQAGLTGDTNPLLSKDTTDHYQTPWTTGDYLKVIELAGKGIGAFGKAEQEQVYPDKTPISKASFDVRPQLYQSQRNLSNYMSGVDTGNINLRRSLFGQAYAQKLNTDSQILNQYQQMNNQAQIQYEDRISNRRRFNVGQQTYTDNINAANRAAQDMVTQNALTSVGQFGEDLNRKQYSTDLINLLQLQYPDVYKNVYNQLNAKKVINGQ